jgi:hypothetical protein
MVSVACSTQKQSPEELKERRRPKPRKSSSRMPRLVAEGVKEGWSKGKQINLRTRPQKDDLMGLPGMTRRLGRGD